MATFKLISESTEYIQDARAIEDDQSQKGRTS